jgi:hypothetical protein
VRETQHGVVAVLTTGANRQEEDGEPVLGSPDAPH